MSVCVQGFVELAALEDILAPYVTQESRGNFDLSRKHLGSWDIEGNERFGYFDDAVSVKWNFQTRSLQRAAKLYDK